MTPRTVAETYWNIECTRDVGAILNCYNADAELVVPELGRLVGHDQIRQFYQSSVERFPVLEVKIVDGAEAGDTGAFEWASQFRDHDGKPYPLTGINMIHVRDGKFQSVHVYYDPTAIAE